MRQRHWLMLELEVDFEERKKRCKYVMTVFKTHTIDVIVFIVYCNRL